MGKKERNKGYRGENNLRKLFIKNNFKCVRVPLSGGDKNFKGDLILEDSIKIEVKIRGDGFKNIYKWLEENDLLSIKADNKEYLIVMTLNNFIKLLKEKK